MIRISIGILCSVAAAAMLSGCATVDPRLDYEQVGQKIITATGAELVYSPEQEEVLASYVEELLEGGLTAEEAVQVSLLRNPGLQALFAEIGMARADVVQAGLLSNPSLGITARLPSGGGLATLEGGLAQNIAELWQIAPRKRAAERSLDRTILQIAHQATTLASDAKTAYFEAVAADERHRIAQDNLGVAANLLELSLTRQEVGASNELEVNLSRSVALRAQLDGAAARLASGEARRSLAILLGLSTDAILLQLVDPLPEIPAELPDLEGLLRLARSSRLDIKVAEEALSAAEARLLEEQRRVLSGIEVGFEFERGGRGPSEGGRDLLADIARTSIAKGALTAPGIQPRSERDKDTDFSIGPSLGIELPIFDQNQAQIAKARYVYQQAAKLLAAVEQGVTQDVYGAADRALAAWRILGMYRDQLMPLAQANLDLSHEAYKAGRASFLAVLEAQRFFLEIRSEHVTAAQTAAIAVPELERAIGLPFAKIVSQTNDSAPASTDAEPAAEKEVR